MSAVTKTSRTPGNGQHGEPAGANAGAVIGAATSAGERALAVFLNSRYGDGSILLRSAGDRELARTGRQLGLISDDGFITPAGRALAARY